MAITHDQFLELLREEGLKFARFDTGTAVLLPFGSCTVLADLIEDGEAVLVAAGGVFNLSGCSNKAAGLEWIATRNYRIKIGRWGYDPGDGEVRIDYVHPIEDGDLTGRQLARLIHTLAREARMRVGELARAASNGSAASTEDADDEDQDDSGPFGGIEDLLDTRGGVGGSRDLGVSFSPDEIPDGAVSEAQWMEMVVRALRVAAPGVAALTGSCDHARIATWMDQLRQLRDRSVAESEESWATATLRDAHGLSQEEELALLWVASRRVAGDNRISEGEISGVVGSQGASATQRLLELGLLKPRDDDGLPPYCLSDLALASLGQFLGPSAPA